MPRSPHPSFKPPSAWVNKPNSDSCALKVTGKMLKRIVITFVFSWNILHANALLKKIIHPMRMLNDSELCKD